MNDKKLFLVCNAHLDPVWLWRWPEGAAEALSTFRTATRFCEEFEGFIFCHNEALLYEWIEEYEPELLDRIKRLVRQGRWHIMGGWHLQPDCNIPGGESFVRQILTGLVTFEKMFGVRPRTAVNLDPFGHTRGLVQILKKSGYTSYLFCRPDPGSLDLPADDFLWVGYDGSTIPAHRSRTHYNSERGKAADKVRAWISNHPEQETGLLLWGIGNHGGGPSREDLTALGLLMEESGNRNIRHAVPEEYFSELEKSGKMLPRREGDLNPWAVGCYTSMSRIKRDHRRLENTYFLTEKMAAQAWISGCMAYPEAELQTALRDLLFCQFHDILPGSGTQEVETDALQRLHHGIEICDRLKMRVFFSILKGQSEAETGEYPLFVYNPHPYALRRVMSLEFQPDAPIQNRTVRRVPEIRDEQNRVIPCQLEEESSKIADDWRKRVVFEADLEPGRMHRFSCRLTEECVSPDPPPRVPERFYFRSNRAEFEVNPSTGLLGLYRVDGEDYVPDETLRLLVVADDADPWGMRVRGFRDVIDAFRLMSPEESAVFTGVGRDSLPPVRVIEEGPVRTVVEALFRFGHSALCLHYLFPAKGTEIEVLLRLFWNEKDHMARLSFQTPFRDGRCLGQVAYGVEDFKPRGEELMGQTWTALLSGDERRVLTFINAQSYGFDFKSGEFRCALLRSAAYAAHPCGEGIPLVPQDRFSPRMDQGEHLFRFWINAGKKDDLMEAVDRMAMARNEEPFGLCAFPSGEGTGDPPPAAGLSLSDGTVQMTALKRSEKGDHLILRLFEPTGYSRKTTISIPRLGVKHPVRMKEFEIKTLAVHRDTGAVTETDLIESDL